MRSTSIHTRLLRSHLLIAAVGVAVLLVGGAANYLLFQSAEKLAEESVPASRAAHRATAGIVRSQAALRGWMALGDEKYRQERKRAWDEEIRPSFAALASTRRLDRAQALLDEFEEAQWYVEDVARTPGNEPALLMVQRRAGPLGEKGTRAITAIMALEQAMPQDEGSRQRLWHMANLRSALRACQDRLRQAASSGRQGDEKLWHRELETLGETLAAVTRSRGQLSLDQRDLLDELTRGIAAYGALGRSVLLERRASEGGVAARALRDDVIPLADELRTILDAVEAENDAALQADRKQVATVGWASILVMVGLFFVMAIATVQLSRRGASVITGPLRGLVSATQQLARGEAVDTLQVDSDDELGELTLAFNAMTRQRQEARAELERVNRQLEVEAALQAARLELADILRGRPDVEECGRRVLAFAMGRTGALVGAVHVAGEKGEMTTVATAGIEGLDTSPGGLVRRALERTSALVVDDLPPRYLVASGLGSSPPRWLRLVPLWRGEKRVGVVELAGFDPPSEQALAVLETSRDAMGYELDAAGIRSSLERLLQRTTLQKERLASQQEELRVSNEELGQQAEELRASEEELQAQSEELRQLNEELAAQSRAVAEQNRQLNVTRHGLEETAKELQETSRYKSEFLANMSHELRTPLNSVLLLSRLLSENKSGSLSGKEVEYATAIGTAGAQLLELINDVLDLSKVEAGRVDVDVERIALGEFLEMFRAEFVHLAADKGLELRVELGQDAPAVVETDPGKLRQILVNLTGNAIKFTDSGSVTVAVCAATLRGASSVRLSVRDTGAPIPEAARKSIFEAFHQVDGSTTRAHGGTGLGLTISRELARALGGELELCPQAATGNEFAVTIPLLAALDANTAKVEPEPSKEWRPPSLAVSARPGPLLTEPSETTPKTGQTLLIVEDDEIFSTVVADRARREGLEPILASTGAEALRLAAYHRPLGIVLDIGLPDMDGWAVLGRLKSNPATASIPVHVVTGRDEADRARAEGVAFQRKPLTLEQLGGVVGTIAAGPTARSSVLVVDDDPVHARSVASLLEGEGIRVEVAGTAEEALVLLRARRFACAIVDLGLPQQSGAELIEIAAADPDIDLPKTVLYTGRDLSRAEAETLRARVDTIVLKDERAPERLLQEVSLFLGTVSPPPEVAQVRDEGNDDVMVGRKVLLVDDDMRNVFALMASLEAHGLVIEVASNGKEAVERVQNGAPLDLVLMDIMMPVMNGYDAITLLRADTRFAKLPIIALTAKAMSGDKARCLDAGASDYLPKPVDLDRLLSMMRVWLYDRR